MHLITISISSMTFIGLFTTRSYPLILPSSSTPPQLSRFFKRFSLNGMGEVLVSYCGLSWPELTVKLFNSFNINHKYTSELGNLFWKQQQKNLKQPAPKPLQNY